LHSYFVLYPIAVLAKIFPVESAVQTVFVLSFTGIVALSFLILRRSSVSVAIAARFGIAIVAHAAWAESLLAVNSIRTASWC